MDSILNESSWTKESDFDPTAPGVDLGKWYAVIDYEGGYKFYSSDSPEEHKKAVLKLQSEFPNSKVYEFSPEHIQDAKTQMTEKDPSLWQVLRKMLAPAEPKPVVPSSIVMPGLTAKYNLATPGVLIGTSGFKYKHWFGTFYPDGLPGRDCLAYYATKFPTVEASSTFHQMPEPRVISRWRDSVPAGFTFALRGPKEVTHVRHLSGCGPVMSAFCRRAELLGDKLGPITFQLMESENFDPRALEAFVSSLPAGFRYSVEFRSEPWYNEACYEILAKRNIASVIVGHSNKGIHTVSTADWSHIRMSGHHPDYAQNSYSNEQLMNWRGIIADSKRPTYVYFNNEFKAYAAVNALALMSLMGLQYTPVESAKSIFPVPGKDRVKKEVGPKKVNLEPTTPSANPGEQNGETRPDKMMKDPFTNNDDRYRDQYPATDW